jgi:sodium/potassium-transporting ATPase subunit alpha
LPLLRALRAIRLTQLLWVATIFIFLSWEPFGTPPSNEYSLILALVLICVIVLSSLFSFYQDLSTSRILAGFRDLVPTTCIVIRGGVPVRLSAAELAVGDVVQLETGARIPADMRVLSSSGLRVDKSILTGEAEPVRVVAAPVPPPRNGAAPQSLLEAPNTVFMGSSVTVGASTERAVAATHWARRIV